MYKRVPLVREVLTDLDTPLSAYLKLADEPYTYLLESLQGGERWGRYSFIGLPAARVIEVNDYEIQLKERGEVVERETVDDPLAWIEDYYKRYHVEQVPGLPRFIGGLVGYFGYDTVRYIEPRLADTSNPDDLGCPDILLMVSEEVVILDNLLGKMYFVVLVEPNNAAARAAGEQRLAELVDRVVEPLDISRYRPPAGPDVSDDLIQMSLARPAFEAAVEKIKQYIVDGDCMQVVPSQRMSVPYQGDPTVLYRALRCLNPSPYLYNLNLDEFQIVGSSPEILVRLEDNEVTVRPIAGTRPRGRNNQEDADLADDLLADEKELAEHLMLIDLGRNDISRVCEAGSVRLTERMIIERYSHVMHIVSNVSGKLAAGKTPMDVLRATFPAGTLSGAPKIRAMEIIDELEPIKRGIYGGAIGYLSWGGNIDMAIAIRTGVVSNGMLHVQAGAGIVADSVPEREWEETLSKGRALLKALGAGPGRAGLRRIRNGRYRD